MVIKRVMDFVLGYEIFFSFFFFFNILKFTELLFTVLYSLLWTSYSGLLLSETCLAKIKAREAL